MWRNHGPFPARNQGHVLQVRLMATPPRFAGLLLIGIRRIFPSFSRRGVRDLQTDVAKPPFVGANGVVKIEPRSAPYFLEVTNHPVCAAKERGHLVMAQTRLLEKEGNRGLRQALTRGRRRL